METKSTLAIGLTGGIASGKSAVSNIFSDLNIPVIDADIIAREVVQPNSIGLNQLVDEFGSSIVDKGKLNRSKLRSIVFNDAEKLKKINAILHPLIQTEIINRVHLVNEHYCIVVIPLLCETTAYDWLDRILVVDVSKETQIERLLKRDSISLELAMKMLESQCTRKQRLKIANDVINNQSSMQQLYQRVETLHRLYKTL